MSVSREVTQAVSIAANIATGALAFYATTRLVKRVKVLEATPQSGIEELTTKAAMTAAQVAIQTMRDDVLRSKIG